MTEGLLYHLAGDRFEATSAGKEATLIGPLAARAMTELGIDIPGQELKTLDRYLNEPFDYVVPICNATAETCPVFPERGGVGTGPLRTLLKLSAARRSASRCSDLVESRSWKG